MAAPRLAAAATALAAACSAGAPAPPAPRLDPAPAPASDVTAAELVGHWTGDWGQLVLRVDGERVLGTYSHDQGTLVGALRDGLVRGWWCEAPSREADADAGEVELRVARGAGGLTIDGRWRYGSAGAWHDDWDLVWVSGEPAAELEQRFADRAAFCPRPAPQ